MSLPSLLLQSVYCGACFVRKVEGMVWPVLPLAYEGVLVPTLALSAAFACGAKFLKGWSATWGFLPLFFSAACCRAYRAVKGSHVKPAGRCSREEHEKRKLEVSRAVSESSGPLRMFKGTPSNTFRPQQIGARMEAKSRLDLSQFVHILEVNSEALWCDIEASATFETFLAGTMPHGVIPLVVPELRTITVGGAVVGIGVESSSFRHGFFHEGLLEADILVASGDVLTVRPEGEHKELFKAIPNSLGSFGYLLRLRMRVQRCEPAVEITKRCFDSTQALVDGLGEASKSDADFVDGVALSDTGGVLITAKFAANIPSTKLKRYGMWPMFYPSILHEGSEYMSTERYIWRWDADWFWVTQIFPGLSWRWLRTLCGEAMLRSDVYKHFNDLMIKNVLEPFKLNKDEELIIQDIEIPLDKATDWICNFLKVVPSAKIGKIKLQRSQSPTPTVPIWLCPVKSSGCPLMPMDAGRLYVNFGFWDALEGPETKGGMAKGRINRELEKLCTQLGGIKTLYSSVYLSEDEFYQQYGGEVYKKIKRTYDPNHRLRGWYERLTKA